MTYYSLPTAAGEAELAGGLIAQQAVPFTHIAIGDGGGQQMIPDGRSQLVHQVDIVQITSLKRHPAHANWMVIEAAVPEEKGGYVIRELATIGGRVPGTVLAIGNYPDTSKPLPSSGAATAIILRMIVAFEHSTGAVSLVVDPQAYITLQTVLDQIAAHEAKADPHPQYLTAAEGGSAIDTAMAAHLADPDPHAQYLTAAEGGSAITAAMAAHLAALDPHSQYFNAQRLAALTANTWAEDFYFSTGM